MTIGPHAPDLITERLQGELTVYNPRTESYHVLNTTAAAVWDLATGEHTLEGLLDLLAEAFETTPDAIAHDVQTIIDSFGDAGLLAN